MTWLSNQRIQSIAFYVGGAWAILQAVDFFAQKYDWSPNVFHYCLIVMCGGLPILLVRLVYNDKRQGKTFVLSEILIIILILITTFFATFLFPSRQKLLAKESSAKIVMKPSKPESMEAYLRAKYFLNLSDGITQIDSAIYYLNTSIDLEPDVALTHAMLSQAYTRKLFYVDPNGPWGEKSYVEFERAFALDSLLGYGYLARGYANWTPLHKFPHEECIRDYKRAFQLDPSLDEAYNQLGLVTSHVGLIEESYVQYNNAIRLSATNDVVRSNLIRAYFFDQQHEKVVEGFKRMPPMLYNVSFRLSQHANSLIHLKKYEEATSVIEEVLEEKPNDFSMNAVKAVLLAKKNERQKALDCLSKAERGATNSRGHFHHVAYDIGTAYVLLNENEKAMYWLTWAVENGFPCYASYAKDEFLNNLRDHDPFKKLLNEVKSIKDRMAAVYAD